MRRTSSRTAFGGALGAREGLDIYQVSKTTGLALGRLRYLEMEFPDLLGDAAIGTTVRTLNGGAVALLEKLHDLLFNRGLSSADIRKALAGSSKEVRLAHVLAVTSGKGGVGKTTVAVNLALTLARQGRRVLLFDGDLGLANVHVLLGLSPKRTLSDVLAKAVSLPQAVLSTPCGLDVICGGSGVAALADLDRLWMDSLDNELSRLRQNYDAIVLDTAAGIASQVMRLLRMADDIAVVATPNLSSVLDAYGVVKSARQTKAAGRIHLLINRAEHEAQAKAVFAKIEACAQQFLQFSPAYLGFLSDDPLVERSHQARRPFVLSDPGGPHATVLQAVADRLLGPRTAFSPRQAPSEAMLAAARA